MFCQRIALRQGGTLYYLLTDHLGSTSLLTDANGAKVANSELRYLPYGSVRSGDPAALPTAFNFTGQRLDTSTGLLYYGARYYDPALGRFISPDTVVPGAANPQALNRYSYCYNNPIRYTDPTGHRVLLEDPIPVFGGVIPEFSVRIASDGTIRVISGGQYFRNPHEKAIANYALSGGQTASGGTRTPFDDATVAVTQTGLRGERDILADLLLGVPAMAGVLYRANPGSITVSNLPAGERYWNTETPRDAASAVVPYYPPNRGFYVQPVKTTLQPGTVIDRYGGPGGSFASPQGTPPWARPLPPGAENRPLNTYEVVKPLEVDAGPAMPWFGQPGFGIQYDFGCSIQELIDSGYLRPLQ